MPTRKPGPITRRLLRAPARLYDWKLGWLLGHRFLRLTHIGRTSGRPDQTMLEVIGTTSEGEYLVMAGLGRRADWYPNLLASQTATVAIATRQFAAAFRVLDHHDAAQALGEYERRNRLIAPILRTVLSWLLGWRYDGTDAGRQRLIQELPVIAFQSKS